MGVVALEFQYAWTIEPPYQADETQFALVTAALDNIAEAGLATVVAVRNGPGRNAMMPDVVDEEVITTLYEDADALIAYQEMLRDVVGRFHGQAPEVDGLTRIRNYPDEIIEVGSFVRARVVEAHPYDLVAEVSK